jgi:uncharacterized UBP type Zn finger protein
MCSDLEWMCSPVGIQNVGNTCYFNSFIQTYFMLPQICKEILTFPIEKIEKEKKEPLHTDTKNCTHFVVHLHFNWVWLNIDIHSLSLTHSLTHSLTLSLSHSLTHSLSLSLSHSPLTNVLCSLWEVMKELQKLFGLLVKSNQKWVDPSPFLKSIVDNKGQTFKIGSQEDVSGNLSLLNTHKHTHTHTHTKHIKHTHIFLILRLVIVE